jgi:hypothetical protein
MSAEVSRFTGTSLSPVDAVNTLPLNLQDRERFKVLFFKELRPVIDAHVERLKELDVREAGNNLLLTEADKRIAEADQRIAESRQKKVRILVSLFYKIFHGKQPVPAEKVDSLFTDYLANKSMTIEEDKENSGPELKGYLQLNAMDSIIRYLKDHPNDVIQCDFRPFNTHLIQIPTLAQYLAQNSCKVRAIAISRQISDEAKESLASVMSTRANFKVHYF